MISYKIMNQKDITTHDLDSFERYQQTKEVMYVKYVKPMVLESQKVYKKEMEFIDDWDQQKLQEICKYLQTVNGTVIYVYDDQRVIGFANIDHHLYGDYINMPYIHISRPYRRKRLAKELFYMICEEALKHGAKKLYISAHPNPETYRFYQSVGCVITQNIIKELYDIEPYDLQLEKDLSYIDLEQRRKQDCIT